MTLLGPDISSYQAGLNLAKLTQASFVIAKASEGTYYTDAGYLGWARQARAAQLPFCWYHFLTDQDAAAQVQHTLSAVGDRALPGMLDVEPQDQTGSRPTLDDVTAYADIAAAAGLALRLVYLPHWYWQQLGSPDLSPLAGRGLVLVASGYPGGTGTPAALYPGDGAAGWDGYGGMEPGFWQYTDQADDGGQALDYNAFRGSPADLIAVLSGRPPTIGSTVGGLLMALSDADQAQVLKDVANVYGGMFFGGSSMGAVPPGAQSNSLVAKLDFLIAQAGKTAAVDVGALAAVLGPQLHPATDVTALAAALIPHLPGAVDPGALAQALAGHIKVV